MLETSKDVLNIVLAVSIGGIAFFLCWGLYYMVQVGRNIFIMVKGFKEKIDRIDEILKILKDKIEHSTSYLLLIGEGVKKLVEIMKKREEKEDK
ncbi:hypothetical protein C0583_05275 [Candidatus Parcubacteria bacterium]|nr:MAG: hypothetical protein C0583_05275 [Candidatus Parcubacteria bacterium]